MSGWGIGNESRTSSWVIDWWNVERGAVYGISWLTLAVRPWCGTCVDVWDWNLLQFRNERSFLQDQHYISRCRPRYLHAVNVNEWRADYTIFPLITERSVKVERSARETCSGGECWRAIIMTCVWLCAGQVHRADIRWKKSLIYRVFHKSI